MQHFSLSPSPTDTLGFYLHVPFCAHICPYCDFLKTATFNKKGVDLYFQLALKQLTNFLDTLDLVPFARATFYIGGGTPGLFPAEVYLPFIELLKKRFSLEEVTLETNPLNLRPSRYIDYRQIGIDRITLGAQSLDANRLTLLGRKHTPQMVLSQLEALQKASFSNIQVDLIYGITTPSSDSYKNQIETLFQAGASGLSAYALTLEERTLFGERKDLVDDDQACDDYEEIYDTCLSLGAVQRETSNFSRFETLHNNIYWTGGPYIGLGTGAHGLLPATDKLAFGRRYRVGTTTKEKSKGHDIIPLDSIEKATPYFELHFEEERSRRDYYTELIFLLLRTPKGLPLSLLGDLPIVEGLLLSSPLVQRGILEKKLAIIDGTLHIVGKEKIRGDSWVVSLLSCLDSVLSM